MRQLNSKWLISTFLAVVIAVVLLPVSALAATTVTPLAGQVSVTDSVGTGSLSSGTVTITAKGSLFSKKTNTVTITNASSSRATIGFSYSASTYSSFTIAGVSASASGNYSTSLDAGGTIAIVLTSNSGLSNTTATLTLSGFSYTAAAANPNITINCNETYGSMTVNGAAVSAGTTTQVSNGSNVTLVATTKNGSQFLGWVDDSGEIKSTNATYSFTAETDLSVKAIFAHSDLACFYVGGGTSAEQGYGLLSMSKFTYYTVPSYTYLFDDLNDAATAAQNSTSKYVVLANSATLPADDYTIPSGVTLVIPFDSSNSTYTANPQWTGDKTTYTTPSAYRTLTMADGANLTIDSGGAMSVPGKHTYAAGGTACVPTGKVGMVKMNSGSTITVNGSLYAYGYIYGSGSVNVGSSGTVYELLQVYDCRGGTVTSALNNNAETYGVFPFSQYRVQNIEVPTTYTAGGALYTSLTMNMSSTDFCTGFQMIGSGSGLINMTSGTLTKQYDGSRDRTVFDVNGNVTLSAVSIEVNFVTISSSNFDFPFTNSWTINICSGNTTVNQDVSFLPGSEVYIAEGTTVTISSGKSVYIYDADQWGKFCYSSESSVDVAYKPLKYSPTLTYTRSEADLVDAKVLVNGTLDASAGGIYTTKDDDTTADGANIYSTGTGTVKTGATASGTTYQYSQISDDDGYGTEVYIDIAVTSAQLKHENGDYLSTAVSTTYNHDHYICEHDLTGTAETHGMWHAGTYANTSEVTDPTCETDGYTTYTCACGHSYTGDETDALGHKWNDGEVTTEPTCTEKGVKTYTCTVCGSTKTEAIAALGHTEVIDEAVDATCTATGLTEGKHCSVCSTVIIAQQVVAATGHNYTSEVTTAATCTTAGVRTYTCQNDETHTYTEAIAATGHSYTSVVTPPTCTEQGYTTHTCTCGHSYKDTYVPATGIHADENSDDVCDVCGTTLVTYSVTITWTDLNFTYKPKYTWDPTDLRYKVDGGEWSTGGSVTIQNNSTASVVASLQADIEEGLSWNPTISLDNNGGTIAAGGNLKSTISVSGTPYSIDGQMLLTTTASQIGTITITLEKGGT